MRLDVHLNIYGTVICIHCYTNLLGMGSQNINFPKRMGDVKRTKMNWITVKSVGFYDENYFIVYC
jgi:hypothetical protein